MGVSGPPEPNPPASLWDVGRVDLLIVSAEVPNVTQRISLPTRRLTTPTKASKKAPNIAERALRRPPKSNQILEKY